MPPTVGKSKGEKFHQRWSLQARLQHFILAISVIILIVTGVPLWCLKHPDYIWWAQSGIQDYGFIELIRAFHKVASVAMMAVCIYHLLYLLYSREGRREFWALMPGPKDFVDVSQNLMYFVGLRKDRPRFGRYTYYEKFDYWAVYWGAVIMIASGLTLWFTEISLRFLPWFQYELAALIHADEAILATLAICVWHFYNVHYNPARFPGTLLWWHGKISEEEMMEEHPLEYEEMMRAQRAEQQDDNDQ